MMLHSEITRNKQNILSVEWLFRKNPYTTEKISMAEVLPTQNFIKELYL